MAFRWPGDKKASHPLSLKDLSLAGQLERLKEMGVACLKLEGRMKRPEYVAVVTKIYATALKEGREPTRDELAQLEAAFSRQGFTQGYYRDQKGPAMFGTRPEGTKDPEELFAQARAFYGRGEHRLTPVTFTALAKAGDPLMLTVEDDAGHRCFAQGEPPQAARNRETTAEQLIAQLGKTGGTVYTAASVQVDLDPGLAVPLSAVNALRRDVLGQLDALRSQPGAGRTLPFAAPKKKRGPSGSPELTVSLHRWAQSSKALLEQGPALVWLPCEEAYQNQAELADSVNAYPDIAFGVVFPRVAWDRERDELRKQLAALREIGVTQALLGHIGQLGLARELGFVPRGDFGLGLVNDLTAQELARLGFVSATASFECRLSQVRDLSKELDTSLIVYGRLPLMLTENCILKNRGKGCHCQDTPQSLRDRKGEEFPVERAWGCRNELFNAKTLWLADKDDWKKAGLRYARLAFLREDAKTCARILRAYRTGEGDGPEEFTRGLYYRGGE